ncbi:MAG: protein translocase subunit SecD [Candidatus Andersenbacteria bacterium]|nr:protein translocase subunit SecD [Candidatus Andersenbacteria bacterium]
MAIRRDTRRHLFSLGLILVILGLSIWIVIPQHPSISWGIIQRDLNVKYGLDLKGGSHLVYRALVDKKNLEQSTDSLAGVRDVIEKRVNAFGIAEPIVQTNRVGDEYRIIVELAGVYDPQEAIKKIGETPQLDFRTEISGAELAKKLNIDAANIEGSQFEPTGLSGKNLKRTTVSFDQVTGTPQVDLEFDGEGTKLFADITKAQIGKRVAIYLDGVPISAPVVQSEITNGRAVISGGFTVPEAKELAQRLNAGALPIPIELIGQQTVGATLGKTSIGKSVVAGVIGLIAVMVWMTAYYRLPGLVAAVALAMYGVVFLAIVKLLPVTLTLAGIAGFILSIGMAVDGNVLIFERMREHIRAGKSVWYALEDGLRDAWSSIHAANVAGLITALILYMFGTSIVRGFALTFAVGIVLSLFSSIMVTRTFLSLILKWSATHKPFLLAVKTLPNPK